MGAAFFPVFLVTGFWAMVGIVLPFYMPKGPNRGYFLSSILQLILMLTGATCWLFWLCCYMAQMNPLIGPKLHNTTVLLMEKAWGSSA